MVSVTLCTQISSGRPPEVVQHRSPLLSLMETPEVVVIPATPIASSLPSRHHRPPHESTNSTISSTPSTSHTQSSGSLRSSSEDTAVTIFSMYTDVRENWTAKTKVIALNDVEPVAVPRSRRHSVEIPDLGISDSRRGIPDNAKRHSLNTTHSIRPIHAKRGNQPPTSFLGNGHVVVAEAPLDHRHSIATSSIRSSLHRSSEESTSLPYTRHSHISSEQPPPPAPPPPPSKSPPIFPEQPAINPSVSEEARPPAAGSSKSSPNHSFHSQPLEGEDPDSYHVRSTYAQLDASGVRGDGFEEGVELTRAKQGGTTYLRSQPHDRGRGSGSDLSPKEVAMLASVDRYGFVVAPSAPSDRLLLLPYSALLKPLSPVRPSSRPSSSSPTLPPLPTLPPAELIGPAREKELSRTEKWKRMLESDSRDGSGNVLAWRVVSRKERKLRERVYKGIPDVWRAAAWVVLIDRIAGITRTSEEILAQQYRGALERPSNHDIQIDLDVPRTISGHVMFRTRYGMGQRALFHVLHAFSLLCPDCGYVQGMGPIAATLLCYYEPEKAYAVLVHIHHAYAMHTIFSPGFPGLLEAIYVQERVMERMLPDVYAAFKKHNISSTSYTTKWYITLFANTVPFQMQLRLWDAFFLEGRDMIVIIAVSILWVFKDQLTAASATFETILSLLSSFFVPESEDALMKWIERALGDRKLRADMQSWRDEWGGLVAQGQDLTVLL